MSRSEDIKFIIGQKIVIGLSQILGITLSDKQIAGTIRYASGGSLELGMTQGSAWGTGYLMGTGEIANINCAGTFYVAATGATVTAYVLRGLSMGSEQ